jgi:predicted aspartyl protease
MHKHILVALPLVILEMSVPARADEQNAWPADCKLERVAQVPMTLISGHVTIPASINGKDVTLGIDTGGFLSSLSTASIHRLGVAQSVFAVHIDNLTIGDLNLNSVYTGEMNSFPGVDGIIAHDVLGNYDVALDFGDNKFNLFRHHPCASQAVYWTNSYTAIPFGLTFEGHVRIPVTLDGRNTYAILDTAAPISVISMQDANNMFGLSPSSTGLEVGKPVAGPEAAFGVLAASVKAATAFTYPFKTLSLAGVMITNPPIELVEESNFLGRDYATLVIGNDVLSRFHLYIAYQEHKLYITDAQAR